MTFGEILLSGLALNSVGIVGLLLENNETSQTQPAAPLPAERQREAWRREHGVRPVESQWEGFGLAEIPNGMYGYTYAPALASPLFAKRTYQSFEVHKAQDGTEYLVGCLTPAEAAQISAGQTTVEVRLYPEPYGEAQVSVCLPLDRVERKSSNPTHEDGGWVPLLIAPGR
jgi:hypothetical protein